MWRDAVFKVGHFLKFQASVRIWERISCGDIRIENRFVQLSFENQLDLYIDIQNATFIWKRSANPWF